MTDIKLTQENVQKMLTDLESENTEEKTSVKIVELIKSNKNISIPEMAESIGISERSIERNIEKLKQERIGPAKGEHWQVTE